MLHIPAAAPEFLHSPSPGSLSVQLFSQCRALQLQSVLLLLGLATSKKVTTCCPPFIHWRTYVLWSNGSFNVTIFSFLLCCASGCWIFTIFLPSRFFRLIMDYILDSLWIEYFSFNFILIRYTVFKIKRINISRHIQYSTLNFWEN